LLRAQVHVKQGMQQQQQDLQAQMQQQQLDQLAQLAQVQRQQVLSSAAGAAGPEVQQHDAQSCSSRSPRGAAAGAGGPEVQSEVQQQDPRNRMIEDMMCSVLWSYIVSKLKEESSTSEGTSTSASQAPQGRSSIRRPQGGSSGCSG